MLFGLSLIFKIPFLIFWTATSLFLNPTNEYDNYHQKVKISISQISYFVKNLLKTNENKKLEIYIVSDHPPVLTSFKNKCNSNYSFLIKNFN